jgi:1-acyl-sn-glycerol-3-phosphate acyltransferase
MLRASHHGGFRGKSGARPTSQEHTMAVHQHRPSRESPDAGKPVRAGHGAAVRLVASPSPVEPEGLPTRIAYAALNLLQAIGLVVGSVFWITLAFVCTVLTFNRNVPLAMARRCWAPTMLWISRARFELEPLPDVDWSRPHIFVMNHQSMLDIPCAFAAIPANIRFVAKHTLKYVPFLGWYMWMTGMVFVNRSNRAQAVQSLREAGERIRAGANILAYPEGTRTRDGKLLPFKKGPFVLALEAKVPIIPVAIEGSYNVLPSDGFRVRPGQVRMKLGTPIETAHRSEDDREALMADVRKALIRLNRELGGAGGE